jgi:hypothetical protein
MLLDGLHTPSRIDPGSNRPRPAVTRVCQNGELASEITMSRTRLPAIASVLVLTAVFAVTLQAQTSTADNPCDSKLIPSKTDPLAYSRRGERCEGVYYVPVSGSADLSLVAFTEPTGPFRVAADERVNLQWMAGPSKPAVHVRVVSLKSGVYYRMDAVGPEGSDHLEWPGDVVGRLNLTSADIALAAWAQQTIAGRAQNVYVPLVVGKSAGPGRKDQYVAKIVPGSEVSELYLTLAAVGADGRDEKFLKRDEALKGFYPAERPISVPVSDLPAAGLYRLRLGAVLRGGGSTTTTFVFYHPGS